MSANLIRSLTGYIAAQPLNHLLRQNSWANDRLKPYAGKVLQLCYPLVKLEFVIADTGELNTAPPGVEPHAVLNFSLFQAARAGLLDKSVLKQIQTSGEPELLSEVIYVLENLNWDVEEDLSKFVGDIAAHRLVGGAKNALETGKQSVENIVRTVAEYWTEEKPLLAKANRVRQLSAEIDAVREGVSKLEQRFEKIALLRSKRTTNS